MEMNNLKALPLSKVLKALESDGSVVTPSLMQMARADAYKNGYYIENDIAHYAGSGFDEKKDAVQGGFHQATSMMGTGLGSMLPGDFGDNLMTRSMAYGERKSQENWVPQNFWNDAAGAVGTSIPIMAGAAAATAASTVLAPASAGLIPLLVGATGGGLMESVMETGGAQQEILHHRYAEVDSDQSLTPAEKEARKRALRDDILGDTWQVGAKNLPLNMALSGVGGGAGRITKTLMRGGKTAAGAGRAAKFSRMMDKGTFGTMSSAVKGTGKLSKTARFGIAAAEEPVQEFMQSLISQKAVSDATGKPINLKQALYEAAVAAPMGGMSVAAERVSARLDPDYGKHSPELSTRMKENEFEPPSSLLKPEAEKVVENITDPKLDDAIDDAENAATERDIDHEKALDIDSASKIINAVSDKVTAGPAALGRNRDDKVRYDSDSLTALEQAEKIISKAKNISPAVKSELMQKVADVKERVIRDYNKGEAVMRGSNFMGVIDGIADSIRAKTKDGQMDQLTVQDYQAMNEAIVAAKKAYESRSGIWKEIVDSADGRFERRAKSLEKFVGNKLTEFGVSPTVESSEGAGFSHTPNSIPKMSDKPVKTKGEVDPDWTDTKKERPVVKREKPLSEKKTTSDRVEDAMEVFDESEVKTKGDIDAFMEDSGEDFSVAGNQPDATKVSGESSVTLPGPVLKGIRDIPRRFKTSKNPSKLDLITNTPMKSLSALINKANSAEELNSITDALEAELVKVFGKYNPSEKVMPDETVWTFEAKVNEMTEQRLKELC